jgi:hypothetical protein
MLCVLLTEYPPHPIPHSGVRILMVVVLCIAGDHVSIRSSVTIYANEI